MSFHVIGASTLKKFTSAIEEGFHQLGHYPDFDLIQIHACPNSRNEDLQILEQSRKSTKKQVFLIHRPDELLHYPELLDFFKMDKKQRIIFLGDLLLSHPFWHERKDFITIVPHPYFSLKKPSLVEHKLTVGSFTSWGEMRKLEHYLKLMDKLMMSEMSEKFVGVVGGSLNGYPLTTQELEKEIEMHELNLSLGQQILLIESPFIPHFNVQLYHLYGKKRFGESSGSLHSGISIPVIFEANGIERIEGVAVIKIPADNDLTLIDFDSAVLQISSFDVKAAILKNESVAKNNQAIDFARKIMRR